MKFGSITFHCQYYGPVRSTGAVFRQACVEACVDDLHASEVDGTVQMEVVTLIGAGQRYVVKVPGDSGKRCSPDVAVEADVLTGHDSDLLPG